MHAENSRTYLSIKVIMLSGSTVQHIKIENKTHLKITEIGISLSLFLTNEVNRNKRKTITRFTFGVAKIKRVY